jgi:hypothetical protein
LESSRTLENRMQMSEEDFEIQAGIELKSLFKEIKERR